MKKIEFIENHGRFKKGTVEELDDFGVSHALGFKYGRLYAGKPVEVQAVVQPETRAVDHVHGPIEIKPIDTEPVSFFKRRGRKSKA